MLKKKIIAVLCLFPLAGGCTLLGFLLSPSSSDVDIPELLGRAIAKDLRQKVQIRQERIHQAPQTVVQAPFSWAQAEQDARQAGAAFFLYVEIIEYELIPLHQKDYYMGKLTARSLLLDTHTGKAVWPAAESGHLVRTVVDFEKEGRTEILWRLTTAAAHCIVREFYNCSKPAYWSADEVKSLDTLMEDMD
jgi:hypothetical protein